MLSKTFLFNIFHLSGSQLTTASIWIRGAIVNPQTGLPEYFDEIQIMTNQTIVDNNDVQTSLVDNEVNEWTSAELRVEYTVGVSNGQPVEIEIHRDGLRTLRKQERVFSQPTQDQSTFEQFQFQI